MDLARTRTGLAGCWRSSGGFGCTPGKAAFTRAILQCVFAVRFKSQADGLFNKSSNLGAALGLTKICNHHYCEFGNTGLLLRSYLDV